MDKWSVERGVDIRRERRRSFDRIVADNQQHHIQSHSRCLGLSKHNPEAGWRSIVSRQVVAATSETTISVSTREVSAGWSIRIPGTRTSRSVALHLSVNGFTWRAHTTEQPFRLYVNGVKHFSTAHSGTFTGAATDVVIGASYNDAAHTATEAFSGIIDEVRLYGRALTAADVNALYLATGTTSNVPPTVTITSAGGGPVSDTVQYTASASDADGAVLGVHFRVDGVISGVEDVSPPYRVDIDTVLDFTSIR